MDLSSFSRPGPVHDQGGGPRAELAAIRCTSHPAEKRGTRSTAISEAAQPHTPPIECPLCDIGYLSGRSLVC